MKINKLILILFIFHLLLGISLIIPNLSLLASTSLFIIAIAHIIISKNENNEAILWIGYFVSFEVVFRSTGGFFFWEFGKYGSILLAITALFIENKQRPLPVIYFYYILLLLIGIIFSKVPFGESYRKAIAFNLSGPLQLGIMAIFCYRRRIDRDTLINMFKIWLLPIISMCSFLWYRTPSFSEIIFNSSSNFQTSGGFGPNQVSTLLGFGLFLITVLLISKKYFSGIKWLDWIILSYIGFRGLLTFSRGGIIAALISIGIFAVFYLYGNRNYIITISRYVIVALALGIGLFFYTSDLTGGKLENRYANKSTDGLIKKDLTSGRGDIFIAQIDNWVTKPLFGIGVGSGKYLREQQLDGITIASHNEISRTLEEHGLIGFFILILLISTPIIFLKDIDIQSKGLILGFLALWFLTILHSAMRVALPGFLYGISLLSIYSKPKSLLEE